MKRRLRITTPFVLLALLLSCHDVANSLLCHHSTQSEVKSPDGQYVAEVLWEDCGATEHATTVSLRRTRWFSRNKTLFVAENLHRILLSWSGHTLNVNCGDCEARDIGHFNRKWLDVMVQYQLPKTNTATP